MSKYGPLPRIPVAIDLDGTLAQYDTWQGEEVIGEPIPGALEFLRALYDRGYVIYIFSARAITELGRQAIWRWLRKYGLEALIEDVTWEKLYRFYRIVDDRAITFRGDYNDVLQQLQAA